MGVMETTKPIRNLLLRQFPSTFLKAFKSHRFLILIIKKIKIKNKNKTFKMNCSSLFYRKLLAGKLVVLERHQQFRGSQLACVRNIYVHTTVFQIKQNSGPDSREPAKRKKKHTKINK